MSIYEATLGISFATRGWRSGAPLRACMDKRSSAELIKIPRPSSGARRAADAGIFITAANGCSASLNEGQSARSWVRKMPTLLRSAASTVRLRCVLFAHGCTVSVLSMISALDSAPVAFAGSLQRALRNLAHFALHILNMRRAAARPPT